MSCMWSQNEPSSDRTNLLPIHLTAYRSGSLLGNYDKNSTVFPFFRENSGILYSVYNLEEQTEEIGHEAGIDHTDHAADDGALHDLTGL